MKPEDTFAEALLDVGPKTELPPPTAPIPDLPVPRALTSRSVFSHPEAHPLALDLVLLKHFELEWLKWLPDTLFFEIEKTFSTSIAEVNRVKILAAQTLHVTDIYWNNWEIFEKVLWSLNGQIPRLDVIQPPDLSILMAGVDIANEIRKETYGEDVARYSAAVFLHENVLYAPEPLSFCQKYISQPMFKCQDCGKIGSALPPFAGVCWSCGEHFISENSLSLKPDPEAERKGLGRNVTIFDTYNPDPVKHRFEQLNSLSADQLRSQIKETPEDIQSAKLITAIDYMKHRSQQLADQLTSLRSWLEA